jgi:hypothetical protein
MGHSGPIRIGKSIRFLCIFFLSDTPRIHIQDVSSTYPYRIRIQVSDTLWVEVSMFRSFKVHCLNDGQTIMLDSIGNYLLVEY